MIRAFVVAAFVLATSAASAGVCAVTSVTAVSFGAYDVFAAAPLVFAGSVTYECSDVDPSDRIVIEIDGIADATGWRSMAGPRSPLAYQLYLDAARTVVWGNGAGGSATYGPVVPVGGSPTTIPIYGRVPARQDVTAGAYDDAVVVTLNF